jgi:hypothetical protein
MSCANWIFEDGEGDPSELEGVVAIAEHVGSCLKQKFHVIYRNRPGVELAS